MFARLARELGLRVPWSSPTSFPGFGSARMKKEFAVWEERKRLLVFSPVLRHMHSPAGDQRQGSKAARVPTATHQKPPCSAGIFETLPERTVWTPTSATPCPACLVSFEHVQLAVLALVHIHIGIPNEKMPKDLFSAIQGNLWFLGSQILGRLGSWFKILGRLGSRNQNPWFHSGSGRPWFLCSGSTILDRLGFLVLQGAPP